LARSSVSDEEIQLRKRARRRLVGAIVLVLLAVAAVPLLLDPQPPGSLPAPRVSMPEAASDPAPQPALAIEQQPPSAPTPPAMVDATVPDATPAAPAAEAAVSPGESPASPLQPPLAASAPAAADDVGVPARGAHAPASGAGTATAAGRKQAYAVQLIATTSTDKARALERQLRGKKFPVYTEKTPDGGKTRVRVGPFARQEAAEDARRRLVKLGFDAGRVVPKGE